VSKVRTTASRANIGSCPWPPEGGQPRRQAGVLRGEPPLYLGEHALLVH